MALFFIQTASALEDQIRILAPLKVRICFKPFQTLRNLLSKRKDPIPDLEKSSVVYKIPCGHCSASYILVNSSRNTKGRSGWRILTLLRWPNMSGRRITQRIGQVLQFCLILLILTPGNSGGHLHQNNQKYSEQGCWVSVY